jgi:hypothetical protein
MRGISEGETARKRQAVAAKRSETAVIRRPTRTPDGTGGLTESPTVVGSYACRVAPGAPYNLPMEALAAAQIKATSIWTIGLPHDAEVETDDVIEINGERFEVLAQWGAKRPLTEMKVIALKVG